MQVLSYADKKIAVDDDGCLIQFNDWNEEVARALAELHGIHELTEDRMEMLKFIRDYYKSYDFFPIINTICKRVREAKDCVNEKFINPLVAWKIAGLPHPDEPMVSLLEAGQSPG